MAGKTTEVRGDAPKGGLRRLGEWCARHFVIVIAAWVVALGVLQALNHIHGGEYSDNFALSDVQSEKGLDVLKAHDPRYEAITPA